MYIYAKEHGIKQPTTLLPTGIPKWDARIVKKLAASRPFLQKLLDGTVSDNNPIVRKAMQLLAEHKASIHNRKYLEQIENPSIDLPEFNPGSPVQKTELFTMIGLESEAITQKGMPSWDRDNIERVNKTTTDPELKNLTQALIDYSYGAIIKNTFIPAFYRYTIDGRLYGELKLFGAKSFRYTSKKPNMLNMPSTKSIYSKHIKKCFVAPKGYVVYAIDLSALEDRVMASLSRDENKCRLFIDNLDGHCLNAYGYFNEEVAAHMTLTGNTATDVKKFYELVESGHTELKAIRQKGKPITLTTSVFIQ
jgi:DNA polymerase I-like protein with 3'-5' exonuclease and polymerase domains